MLAVLSRAVCYHHALLSPWETQGTQALVFPRLHLHFCTLCCFESTSVRKDLSMVESIPNGGRRTPSSRHGFHTEEHLISLKLAHQKEGRENRVGMSSLSGMYRQCSLSLILMLQNPPFNSVCLLSHKCPQLLEKTGVFIPLSLTG